MARCWWRCLPGCCSAIRSACRPASRNGAYWYGWGCWPPPLGQFWWNKGATEVDAGTLAVMNNLHVPVGLLLNLLIWNQHADLPRLALGGAVIVASLWVNRLGRREVRAGFPDRACAVAGRLGVVRATPGYVHLLEPLDSLQVVAHRVVWSIPMVFLLVVATRQWPTPARRLAPAVRRALAAGRFPLTAAMMLLQWGIFIWAPLAGKTLELSLATSSAAGDGAGGAGVLRRAPDAAAGYRRGLRAGRGAPRVLADPRVLLGLLVTALGYPRTSLRRRMGVDALSGFVFEMLFLLLALAALYWLGDESQAFREAPRLWLLLPMLGLISALAFGAMMASSRLLPMGLFGILSYVEPVLLFLVAVLFSARRSVPSSYGPTRRSGWRCC